METITLECPKCGERVEATGEMLEDGIVQCTNPDCRQAFRVDLPQGRVLESGHSAEPQHGESVRAAAHAAAGEQTLVELNPSMLRRHPFQFTGTVVLLLAALVGVIYGLIQPEWWVVGVAGAVALFAAGVLLVWWIQVKSTTLTITSERTILRKGILSRNTTEVRHEDVRNLQVNQTFIERMLGVGDLAISSAGQDELEIEVKGVRDPERIAASIRERQA